MIIVMVHIPVASHEEGESLAQRFRNRTGLVDNEPGFLGFELLKGETEYVSVTRWATRGDLDRWMSSQAHGQAHSRPAPGGQAEEHGHGSGQQSSPPPGRAPSTTIYEVVIPGEGQT